jgi:hypothetical protein
MAAIVHTHYNFVPGNLPFLRGDAIESLGLSRTKTASCNHIVKLTVQFSGVLWVLFYILTEK